MLCQHSTHPLGCCSRSNWSCNTPYVARCSANHILVSLCISLLLQPVQCACMRSMTQVQSTFLVQISVPSCMHNARKPIMHFTCSVSWHAAGATDAARGAADIVLTKPGLSTIVEAIIGARKIFQRMTTYSKYTVAMTFRICFTFGLLTTIYNW